MEKSKEGVGREGWRRVRKGRGRGVEKSKEGVGKGVEKGRLGQCRK